MGTIKDKLQKSLANKDAIKAALIAKGVENVDDVMSHYASFIEAIQSGGGGDLDFTKIGYVGTPQFLIDGLAYAEKIKEIKDKASDLFSYLDRSKIIFFPSIDCSNVIKCISVFREAPLVYLPEMNTINATDMTSMFYRCPITEVPKIHSAKVTKMPSMFYECMSLKKITEIDFSSVTDMRDMLRSVLAPYILIKNLGKSSLDTYDLYADYFWGDDSRGVDNARQSLIDSLITYSYDRKANGMPVATIKLHRLTMQILTEEEKEAITSKGYTLA